MITLLWEIKKGKWGGDKRCDYFFNWKETAVDNFQLKSLSTYNKKGNETTKKVTVHKTSVN